MAFPSKTLGKEEVASLLRSGGIDDLKTTDSGEVGYVSRHELRLMNKRRGGDEGGFRGFRASVQGPGPGPGVSPHL